MLLGPVKSWKFYNQENGNPGIMLSVNWYRRPRDDVEGTAPVHQVYCDR